MFWTGCEVADLNQGQKTIKMNHRNKIQSLVSPTDDPGDAPDCITESSSTTDHNGESAKSTLLPSRRVLNRADVADWASRRIGDSSRTVSKISN